MQLSLTQNIHQIYTTKYRTLLDELWSAHWSPHEIQTVRPVVFKVLELFRFYISTSDTIPRYSFLKKGIHYIIHMTEIDFFFLHREEIIANWPF